MPYAAAPTTPVPLRPDVSALVRQLIDADAGLDDRNCWPAYSRAKLRISRLCGWDAPEGKCDQRQYDMAMHAYCDGCGL